MIVLCVPDIFRPRQEFKDFVLVNNHILITVIHHLQDSLGVYAIVSSKFTCLIASEAHKNSFTIFVTLSRTNNLCNCTLDVTVYVAVVFIKGNCLVGVCECRILRRVNGKLVLENSTRHTVEDFHLGSTVTWQRIGI